MDPPHTHTHAFPRTVRHYPTCFGPALPGVVSSPLLRPWYRYETPFTATGRARGSIQEQQIRKTFLRVANSFPYMKTRLEVIESRTEVLLPIEVAMENIAKQTRECGALAGRPVCGGLSVMGSPRAFPPLMDRESGECAARARTPGRSKTAAAETAGRCECHRQ